MPSTPGNTAGAMLGPIHDAGVELRITRGVRTATKANRTVRTQAFDLANACFDGIKPRTTMLHRQ
jgi:hypothetical protein